MEAREAVGIRCAKAKWRAMVKTFLTTFSNRCGFYAASVHAIIACLYFSFYLGGSAKGSAGLLATTIDLPVTIMLAVIASAFQIEEILLPANGTAWYLMLIVIGTMFYFIVGKLVGWIFGKVFLNRSTN